SDLAGHLGQSCAAGDRKNIAVPERLGKKSGRGPCDLLLHGFVFIGIPGDDENVLQTEPGGQRLLHVGKSVQVADDLLEAEENLLAVLADFHAPRGGDQQARVLQERSEEHTSELQSRENLVCRLLLEKKKTKEND